MVSTVAAKLCALTLLVLLFGSRTAYGEPKLFIVLDYETDPALGGCPNARGFMDLVRGQLGYDPFRTEGKYVVVARTAPSQDGVAGSLRWYDATQTQRGERVLSSSHGCAALVRAMSFAMTVQIQLLAEQDARPPSADASTGLDPDPSSATAERPEPPVREPSTEAATDAIATPPPARKAAPSQTRSEWRFLTGVGPVVGWGLAPGTSLGGRIFGAVYRGQFGLDLGVDADLPSRFEAAAGRGFDSHFVGASLAGCGSLSVFSACLVNRWARLAVRGYGVDVPRSTAGTSVQLGPRLAAGTIIGRGWIGILRAEALVALIPLRVTLNQRQTWSMPALSLSVGADLAAVFRDNP